MSRIYAPALCPCPCRNQSPWWCSYFAGSTGQTSWKPGCSEVCRSETCGSCPHGRNLGQSWDHSGVTIHNEASICPTLPNNLHEMPRMLRIVQFWKINYFAKKMPLESFWHNSDTTRIKGLCIHPQWPSIIYIIFHYIFHHIMGGDADWEGKPGSFLELHDGSRRLFGGHGVFESKDLGVHQRISENSIIFPSSFHDFLPGFWPQNSDPWATDRSRSWGSRKNSAAGNGLTSPDSAPENLELGRSKSKAWELRSRQESDGIRIWWNPGLDLSGSADFHPRSNLVKGLPSLVLFSSQKKPQPFQQSGCQEHWCAQHVRWRGWWGHMESPEAALQVSWSAPGNPWVIWGPCVLFEHPTGRCK